MQQGRPTVGEPSQWPTDRCSPNMLCNNTPASTKAAHVALRAQDNTEPSSRTTCIAARFSATVQQYQRRPTSQVEQACSSYHALCSAQLCCKRATSEWCRRTADDMVHLHVKRDQNLQQVWSCIWLLMWQQLVRGAEPE